MEVASRHVRHTHRSLVRMVSSRQLDALDALDGGSRASSQHKGVPLMTRKFPVAWFLTFLTLVASMILVLPQNAAAQDQDPSQAQAQAQAVDPPTRVARLNYVQGSVSFQPAGEQDWLEADINRPLTTGDNLWADKDSRGEIHIGATSIRLSSETGISFLNLDDRTVQLQLAQGTIEVHVRRLEPGNAFEIDTPNLAFTLAAAGEYRIQTDPDGNSTGITVREGAGQVTGAGESYDLAAGQQYIFNGTDQLSFNAQAAPEFDDFEDWCQAQDQRENSSPSARYVSRDVDGYYDLDGNGDWRSDAEYGIIWVPSGVVAGWAPYRYGHWVWIGPWGWTWVEDEPWGFAPFHYGRWAYVRGGHWGWVPGPMVVRPAYAPALVGFVGGGFGFGVGFGGGFAGVAWYPLGPRDVYIPGYRNSTRVRKDAPESRVNYMYADNAAAVTAVSRETFVDAKPVGTGIVRVTREQLQSAHVIEQTPLAPTRSSYVAAAARPARAKPPVAFSERPVVARLNPPMPVTSHNVVHAVNTSAAPRGGQAAPSAPRSNNAAPARPPVPMYTNDSLARTPQYPNTDARANVNTNANERQNANGNANANERPNTNERPPANDTVQQHPAVKFTPPTKAKDDDYDVHPPLNHKASTPPPAEHHEAPAPAPASLPAPPPKSEPPASRPKN
jgi:hypothetical protein